MNLSGEDGSWLFDRISPWLSEQSVAKVVGCLAGRDDVALTELFGDIQMMELSLLNQLIAVFVIFLPLQTTLIGDIFGIGTVRSMPNIFSGSLSKEVESTSHILRDYVKVKPIWEALFGQEVVSLCMDSPVASNEIIFQGAAWDPNKVSHHIWVVVREFHAVLDFKVGTQHEKNSICKALRWEPSEEGWVKWNLDGSVHSQGVQATSRCVIRNEWGKWITGVTRYIGQATIAEAELWAFKDASHLSLVRGDQNVWFESDSITAVNFVRHGVSYNHPCFDLVSAIRNDIAKISRTHITHVLREGNYVADGVAGLGHYFPMGPHVLSKPPASVSLSILADVSSICFPRLCLV
ncbi:Ribonuclease H-like superfamily [Sesbania bispinosa]|nr:Ribonuclease H-like superfamily [Sesbania bispinosa]